MIRSRDAHGCRVGLSATICSQQWQATHVGRFGRCESAPGSQISASISEEKSLQRGSIASLVPLLCRNLQSATVSNGGAA